MLPVNKVLLEEPKGHFKCVVCFENPLQKPVLFQCGHTVCTICCSKLKTCPLCRKEIKLVIPNYSLQNIIGDLKCRCDFHFDETYNYNNLKRKTEERCPEIISLKERENHIQNCKYAPEFCNWCSKFFLKADFKSHRENCKRQVPFRVKVDSGVNVNIYTKLDGMEKLFSYRLKCPKNATFQRVLDTLEKVSPQFTKAKYVLDDQIIDDPSKTLAQLRNTSHIFSSLAVIAVISDRGM